MVSAVSDENYWAFLLAKHNCKVHRWYIKIYRRIVSWRTWRKSLCSSVGGDSVLCGPQNQFFAFYRWSASVSFRLWPLACTEAVWSRVWSSWNETQPPVESSLWVRKKHFLILGISGSRVWDWQSGATVMVILYQTTAVKREMNQNANLSS